MDSAAVVRMLEQLPATVEARLLSIAEQTAQRIATEARRRVPILTGVTREGIDVERMEQGGAGYVVVAYRQQFPNLPLWLEKGTKHMTARPFFDVAAELERGPYARQVREALEDELRGLGE